MIKQTILNDIKQCHGASVLVVGDVMLDEYHWCKVDRISPEAPVPICRVQKTTLVPGGAGNVAQNIVALGSDIKLFGVLGYDSSGSKLYDALSEGHVPTHYLIQDNEKPTILKSRIIAHHQHVVRVDREDGQLISQALEDRLFSKIKDDGKESPVMVLSDYRKGTLTDSFLEKMIAYAKETDKKVVIDPKGHDYSKYRGAYLLTPNFGEFKECVGKPLESELAIQEEGRRLIERLDLNALLITRSEKGMSLILKSGQKVDIPTKAKEVFDITGAGDTVIAMLAIALASGLPVINSAYLSNYAAGVVVGKVGTACTTLDAIESAIKDDILLKSTTIVTDVLSTKV